MPSNHSIAHRLADRYGADLLGHLYSPGGYRDPRRLAFAIDNGVFAKGAAWDGGEFLGLCDRVAAAELRPLWVLVPDVVADRAATLDRWQEWAPLLRRMYGWALAFALQDGMTPADVPNGADVLFVGGSTRWKWATVAMWASLFPRVHVGRVNSERRLWQCWRLGIESVDGTGWFRENARQRRGLENYLARMAGGIGPDPRIEIPDFFGGHSYVSRGVA